MANDFIMNIETQTADSILNSTMNNSEYIRAQVYTNAHLDSQSNSEIREMISDGERMFNNPLEPASNEKLTAILMDIIDQKLGPQAVNLSEEVFDQ